MRAGSGLRTGPGAVLRFGLRSRSPAARRTWSTPMTEQSEGARPAAPSEGAPEAPGLAVVLIEDEPQIRRFLRASLASQGYRLFEAATGQEGLVEAATRQPDLIILDLGLPDMDGFEVIRQLREWTAIPIIILSARGQERDKIAALDAGADDYVSKPFGVGELLARMRVAGRHAARNPGDPTETTFSLGELHVDLVHRQVTVAGNRRPPDADRISAPDHADPPRRKDSDPSTPAQRGLGTEPDRTVPVLARVHRPAPAKARG